MRFLPLMMGAMFVVAAGALAARDVLPSAGAAADRGPAMTATAIDQRLQDAVDAASERVERFDAETRGYRDPDAEVVITGFGYGSLHAVRAQLQAQLEAARRDLAQEQSRPGRTPPTGTAMLRVSTHSR